MLTKEQQKECLFLLSRLHVIAENCYDGYYSSTIIAQLNDFWKELEDKGDKELLDYLNNNQ